MAILTFWKRKGDRLHSKLTFMPSRSTLDQILRLIVDKTRKLRNTRHLCVALIDLNAVFDSVDRTSGFDISTAQS